MSSHHIVRDEQEPALLVQDIGEVSIRNIESLLEWSPIVMATADVLEKFLSLNYKIDIVLCEEQDRQDCLELVRHQAPVKVLTCRNDALPTAIHYLNATKSAGLNSVVSESTLERIDFASPIFDSLNSINFYCQERRYSLIKNSEWSRWYSKGTSISIKLLVDETKLETNGFDKVEEGKSSLKLETKADGICTVKAKAPFVVIE